MEVCPAHLRDLQDGSEAGLHYLIRMHGKSLRFFAYSLIRNKEAAEEIVSDVFFKLWNGRARFPSAQKIKAFLYIATRNACYDYLDSPKNRVCQDIDLIEELKHPDADLLAQMIQAELIELIYQQVNNLPDQQAAVFRMSYWEGMTTEEISSALGITANSVFLARSRALAKLRTLFKDKQLICYAAFLLGCGSNFFLTGL